MTKLVNLEGVYKYSSPTLTNTETGESFSIRQRTSPTSNKPKNYLFQFNGSGYISSLYEINENTFSIEYQGIKYTLTLTAENQGVIKRHQTNVA